MVEVAVSAGVLPFALHALMRLWSSLRTSRSWRRLQPPWRLRHSPTIGDSFSSVREFDWSESIPHPELADDEAYVHD